MINLSFKPVYERFGPDARVAGVVCYHGTDGNEIRPEHSGHVTALILQASGQKATGITLEILCEGTAEPCYFKLTDLVRDQYSDMINRRMADQLRSGHAIDLSRYPRTPQGYYIMGAFIEDVDYCDVQRGDWIWSIGKEYSTGVILASTGSVFYQVLSSPPNFFGFRFVFPERRRAAILRQ